MMNLDKVFVVDIECDGLLDTLTKLHVLSACYYSENNKWEIISTNDSARIQNLVGNPDNVIVGHNFIGYDKPALEKLGYEFKAQVIDTLGLSWYLYNEHLKHGLESWGERFGVPKPEIEDWENLTYEDYKHRCEEDVKINTNLWVKMLSLLTELYEDRNTIISVIKYFTFKMECLRYQEENKVLIDIEKCKENLGILESIIEEKNEQLKKVMPKVPKYSVRKKPANPFKKDGSLSAAGERWFDLLEKANLPSDYDGELKEVVKYDEPNPASDQQMKDYLTSLGWTPKFFKDGANGKVPQLRDDDKNLCPNIQKLIAIKPELEALDGLSVASHRAGYLKAFLKYADKDGYAIARCNGFAKTIRLKHSNPFVNLPKPTAQYGEYVRSVMIAPPGKVLIGSDVSSLEDKTKQIAIYSYDPKYVEQMNVKGWDAHLDIGERSGLLNSEEIKFFKWFKSKDKKQEDCPEIYLNFSEEALEKEFVRLSKKRAVAKTVNYACLPQDNTEVLTKYGWKFVDDLSIDDEVLTYNSELDKTEFSPIRYIHKYKDAEVINMSNKWWSIESTKDHRWFGKKRFDHSGKKVYKNIFLTTSEINSEFSILNSAEYKGGDSDISLNDAELLGWIVSDGYLKWSDISSGSSTSKGRKRGIKCSIAQSKKKYFNDIKELLDDMEADYSISENNSNVHVFTINSSWIRNFMDKILKDRSNKHEIDWVSLILSMKIESIERFFIAFFKGDGTYRDTKSLTITQNRGNILDAIELCGNLLGYRTTKSNRKSNKKCFDINFSKLNYTTGQRIVRKFSRITDVFCLTVDNGTFLIRQNNTITITGNCTYGAGAAKIAESAGIPQKEASGVVKAYWERNWSVKQYAEDRETKQADGKTWVYNPYSKLWLYLTSEHIKFSACNQNAGVKMFDLWIYFMINEGLKPIAQFHDEVLLCVDEDKAEWAEKTLHKCMENVNNLLGYPIKLEVDVQVGRTYADVH
jgi:hypothetical protein